MRELQDFVCFLRLAVERYQAHDVATPTIHTSELVQRCSMDPGRLRKFDLLLQREYFIAQSSHRAPDGGPAEWSVDDSVWKYKDAYDIDRYLALRAQLIEEVRHEVVPPVSLLASEGAPQDPGTSLDGAATSEDLRVEISDPELRRRCSDLL